MNKILIPLPSDDEQKAITKIFQEVDNNRKSFLQNLKVLYTLKKKLTDDIMKGEVRV